MREKYRDEVDELERKLSKKEREKKELEDDCRDLRNELESSKGEVRDLKVSGIPFNKLEISPSMLRSTVSHRLLFPPRQHRSSRFKQN